MSLADIRHGPITGPEAKYTNLPVHRFDEDWNNIQLKPPPRNDSLQTWVELQQIKEMLSRLTEDDREEIARQDVGIEREFVSLLPKQDQGAALRDLDDLTNELATICQYFKLKFDRPRPEQLFKFWGVDAAPFPSKSAGTPAYPSGHAMLARFVALYLSRKYPSLKGAFGQLAKKMGYNRIQAGLHFPSDYESGVRLADSLWKYFKG